MAVNVKGKSTKSSNGARVTQSSFTGPGMSRSQEMVIEQLAHLEQFHWFVRAHLESNTRDLATGGARTERAAASAARRKVARA